MSDQQEKTEQASSQKLDDARDKGQVARSQELLTFLMVLTFLVVFSASAYRLSSVLIEQTHWWLSNAGSLGRSWGYLAEQGGYSMRQLGAALLPLLAALVLMAILANLLFSGPVFSLTPLTPDFKRLNPFTGIKRMFSRKILVELIKVLVKGMMFALVLYSVFQSLAPHLLDSATLSPLSLPLSAKHMLMRLGYTVLLVMLVAAAFDMWYSRREFGRQMRMSRREVKDEYRRREGDPEIRSKRKGIQQELLKKSASLSRVPEADIIITNPTHYAVALQYRPATMRAPVVLAMGRGLMALRIMDTARQHGVPVLRRPPLARTLHALCTIESPIPEITQTDVARVYRWILAMPGNKVLSS